MNFVLSSNILDSFVCCFSRLVNGECEANIGEFNGDFKIASGDCTLCSGDSTFCNEDCILCSGELMFRGDLCVTGDFNSRGEFFSLSMIGELGIKFCSSPSILRLF